MEVRSGGGDRYKAYGYPVPSTGAVYGGSSIELLAVLCGYCFGYFGFLLACAFGRAKQLLPFCICSLVIISPPVRLARLNCLCLPPSCVVVVVSRRLVCSLTCSWCNSVCCLHRCRELLTSMGFHRVRLRLCVSGPTGLGLGFYFRFLCISLLSVGLARGVSSTSCGLCRVAACFCCCLYVGLLAPIGHRSKLYLHSPCVQSGLVCTSSALM